MYNQTYGVQRDDPWEPQYQLQESETEMSSYPVEYLRLITWEAKVQSTFFVMLVYMGKMEQVFFLFNLDCTWNKAVCLVHFGGFTM